MKRGTELLDPVDLSALAAAREADADVLEPRLHDVRAMTGTREPSSDDLFGRLRTHRDVFAREAPLITGAPHAIFRLAAIGASMIEEAFSRHGFRVLRGGGVECA